MVGKLILLIVMILPLAIFGGMGLYFMAMVSKMSVVELARSMLDKIGDYLGTKQGKMAIALAVMVVLCVILWASERNKG